MNHLHCMVCHGQDVRAIATYDEFAAAARIASDERKPILAYLESCKETPFNEFLRCVGCGFTRIVPAPSVGTLSAFYQNYYGSATYARKREKKIRLTMKRLARIRHLVRGGSFLDVGCNVGFAVEAARLSGFTASGIEIDAKAVAYASEHFPDNRFTATTIEDFTSAEPFDLVHCTEVIEHVIDPGAFMGHLARLTKPGGYLYLTTPDAGHWRRAKNFVDWPEVKPLEHINWQTRKSIRHLLAAHGFEAPRIALNLKPGLRLIARKRAA